MEENQQFVVLPKKENGPLLEGYEILVYVSIRRYMNKETMKAFPALETICEKSGISRGTVCKLIKVIEEKGYFTISKSKAMHGWVNCYTFSNEKSFEPFSYEFLDKEDLTKSEKLNILCTQQFMFKNDGVGKTSYSYLELADKTGLDRKMLSKTTQSLINKGYCSQIVLKEKDPITGLAKRETIYQLDELGQAVVFALQNHEDRITQSEDRIAQNERDLSILYRDNAEKDRKIEAFERLISLNPDLDKQYKEILYGIQLN